MKTLNMDWFKAALVRAVKTFAQTMLGVVVVGKAVDEIDWKYAFSVAIVAAIASILTSIAGIPEASTDGTLLIDTTDPNKDIYRMSFNSALEDLKNKKRVVVKVDPTANLSDGVYLDDFDFKDEEQ